MLDAGVRPHRMTEPIRIANCSGFFGDRLSAAREMVEGGPIDVLTGDWLAELTMLILSRIRAKHPGRGFASTFVTQMEQVMGTCLDRGIRVVANAGGLDPAGCAEAVHEVADEARACRPPIAYVDGDDLLPRVAELHAAGALRPFTRRRARSATCRASSPPTRTSAAGGSSRRCERGADIVVTGRVTDAAVTCGPAAWHHGWARDDWDALAGAVVAGHVIECSAQATGGNYSFFTEVPGMERLGFPWAEVAADGSSVIGKHDGTGGQVSIGTVTSQLLYEIAGPRYLGPDVTARFDTIRLDEIAPDRVRISGVVGEPPPPTLKVAMNELGGYRNDIAVALTGLDIEAEGGGRSRRRSGRRARTRPATSPRCARGSSAPTTPTPTTNEAATAQWRISVKDPDERKVGRAFSNAFVEIALASIPGFYGLSGGPSAATPFGVYRPALVDAGARAAARPRRRQRRCRSTRSRRRTARAHATTTRRRPHRRPPRRRGRRPGRPSACRSARVVGARSGDKGGDANLGVFARTDAAFAVARPASSPSTGCASCCPRPPTCRSPATTCRRSARSTSCSRGLLEEGVAASSRQDAQAKSLGEWLRARVVDVPSALL